MNTKTILYKDLALEVPGRSHPIAWSRINSVEVVLLIYGPTQKLKVRCHVAQENVSKTHCNAIAEVRTR